jgi:RNA polymerase sigma factor (sigma-70 family)
MKRTSDDRPADSTARKSLADARLDAELMNELSASAGKDDRPLAELMARHEKLVFNELRGRNIRRCDVDDVAARVWVKVWEICRDHKWDAGRARHSQDPFIPLLKLVAKSQAMDFHRRTTNERKKAARIVEAYEAWREDWKDHLVGAKGRATKPVEPTPAGVPDRLKPFVGALPERLRGAYELHAEGLTNRKIAERVGCSWGEVSRRLKAARQALAAASGGEAG